MCHVGSSGRPRPSLPHFGGRKLLALLALSALLLSPGWTALPPARAFTAKLSPPWSGPLGSAARRRNGGGGSEEGSSQIATDGDGGAAATGRSGRRKRGRKRRSGSSASGAAVSSSASASDDAEGRTDPPPDDEAERRDLGAPASLPSASASSPSSSSSSNGEWIDVNVNGWPNQSSTLRAYRDYVAADEAIPSAPSSSSSAPGAYVAVSASSSVSPSAFVAFGTPSRAAAAGRRSSSSKSSAASSSRSLGRRSASSSSGINGDRPPTVRDHLGKLLAMTRPDNFPGVVLLHVLGAHKTLKQALLSSSGAPLSGAAAAAGSTALTHRRLLLRVLMEPRMVVTLAALMLTTATSMLVNDYYDARSGVDLVNERSRRLRRDPKRSKSEDMLLNKPLATGSVPLPVAKRFLYYLYAALLLSVPCVPGSPAQFSVILGAMLTFLYTQHLKPVTWLKNALCAGLIAVSPLTSGMAAASVLASGRAPPTGALRAASPAVASLSRLVLTLFAGFLSREILMDVTDVEGDRAAGVQTVPVRHGTRYASRAALASVSAMAVLAVSGPASRLLIVAWSAVAPLLAAGGGAGGGGAAAVLAAVASALVRSRADLARLGLAALSSALMVRGAWNVRRSDGRDRGAADRAVEEGKLTVLPLLASFV